VTVVFQMTLFVAEIFAVDRSLAWDVARILRGASEFTRLGNEARAQSVRRSIEAVTQEVCKHMAKSGIPATKVPKNSNIQWCNYKLSSDDKAQFQSYSPEDDEVAGAVVQMIVDGYRFSLSYDNYNKAIQVTCIAAEGKGPNSGKGFSTFAHSWEKVWALVVFKHYTVFQQVWPDAVAPATRDDFG